MVKVEKIHPATARISVGFKANGLLTNAVHRASAARGVSTSVWLHDLVTRAVLDELDLKPEELEEPKPAPKLDLRRGKTLPAIADERDLDQMVDTMQAMLMRLVEMKEQQSKKPRR